MFFSGLGQIVLASPELNFILERQLIAISPIFGKNIFLPGATIRGFFGSVNQKGNLKKAMPAVRHILPLKALCALLLSSLMTACMHDDFVLPTACECGKEAVEPVREQQGRLHFNAQLNKYTIIREAGAAHAPQYVYILCDLPPGYALEAQQVIFSGLTKPACKAPKQTLAEQQFYDIELTKLIRTEI